MTETAGVAPITATSSTIITTRKAILAFGARAGATTDKIEEMISSDGASLGFRCVDCGYTASKFQSVFAHRSTHAKTKVSGLSAKATAKGIVKEINRLMSENEKLKKSLDNEKSARRRAEKRLKDIEQLSSRLFGSR